MKLVCLILVLAVGQHKTTAVPVDHSGEVVPTIKCAKEQELDPSTLPDPIKNTNAYGENEKLKKYITCMWTTVGVVEEDGSFNEEHLKSFLPLITDGPPKRITAIRDAMLECQKEKGSNAEESAVKFNKCFVEAVLKVDKENKW